MRMLERDVRGDVLYEQLAPEEILCLRDLSSEDISGFRREWQRQQVVEPFAARVSPAGVLGHERGFETADRASHSRQMLTIDALGGAEPEPDAVQRQRVVSASTLERDYRRTALVEIIFGVRLDPTDRGT